MGRIDSLFGAKQPGANRSAGRNDPGRTGHRGETTRIPVIPFTFRALLCPSVLIVLSWSILIISLPSPEFAFYRLSVGFLFFGNHIPCTLYVTSSCVKLFLVANLRYLHALLYTWQIKTSMWSKFSPFINFTQLSDKHIPNHQVWNL